MENQLGIQATRDTLKAIAQAAVVGLSALSDGFQIEDIPKFMGLYPQAVKILGNSSEAMNELKDLQFEEGIDLAKELLELVKYVANELNKAKNGNVQ